MAELTRRQFMAATALTTGFALAVHPVSAQPIQTDTKGLKAGAVKIPVADGKIPAYQARPTKGKDFPVILVISEIFGVHEYIQDVCRRLAKLGYWAIAPELFVRQGDVSKLQDIQAIRAIITQVPDDQVMADLDATLAWVSDTGKASSSQFGITGFCWGGRITWLYAAHNPKIKAGVAWYGRLVGQASALTPKHPIDIAPELKAPILGLYGGADQGIPVESVEQMRTALAQGKSKSEIILYPEAPHAFHADYRPSYRKEAAADGWQQLQSWFQRYL